MRTQQRLLTQVKAVWCMFTIAGLHPVYNAKAQDTCEIAVQPVQPDNRLRRRLQTTSTLIPPTTDPDTEQQLFGFGDPASPNANYIGPGIPQDENGNFFGSLQIYGDDEPDPSPALTLDNCYNYCSTTTDGGITNANRRGFSYFKDTGDQDNPPICTCWYNHDDPTAGEMVSTNDNCGLFDGAGPGWTYCLGCLPDAVETCDIESAILALEDKVFTYTETEISTYTANFDTNTFEDQDLGLPITTFKIGDFDSFEGNVANFINGDTDGCPTSSEVRRTGTVVFDQDGCADISEPFVDSVVLVPDNGTGCGHYTMTVFGVCCHTEMPSSQPSSMPSSKPSESPSSQPSDKPSLMPSCAPSIAPTNAATSHMFYPDWGNGIEKCANDGNEPAYMTKNPSSYMYSTRHECCSTYFDWHYNYCMNIYDDDCADGLWYPDWEGANQGCVNDGNEPDYMAHDGVYYLFGQLSDCCGQHYSWMHDECMANGGHFSGVAIDGKFLFYPDWEYDNDENRGCQNDGYQPAYMTDNHEKYMYQTLEACCKQHYGWRFAKCCPECVALEDGETDSKANNRIWYPASDDSLVCLNDGNQPDYMTKEYESWMYETCKDCCRNRFQWKKAKDICNDECNQ